MGTYASDCGSGAAAGAAAGEAVAVVRRAAAARRDPYLNCILLVRGLRFILRRTVFLRKENK